MNIVLALVLVFTPTMFVQAQAGASLERPEVQSLCKKWEGTLVISAPAKPTYMRCSHIRTHFERTAKEETLFKPIRAMIESVKNRNLLEIRLSEFPKDQKCSMVRGAKTELVCTTIDFQPQTSTRIIGTGEGVPTSAIVSVDANWLKEEMTREIRTQYGAPPTAAFLDFYLDLLVTVSSFLGGPKEQYSIVGNSLVQKITLK